MTPSPDRLSLRVRGPAEMVALVPYLLGFHPAASLVVAVLSGSTLLTLARLDLPATADQMPRVADAVRRVAATTTTHAATAAVLIGYGTAEQVDPSIQAATIALTAARLPVKEALRVDTGRFWSYLCDNPDCCPPEGIPFDPTTSVAAATATAAGLVALPDRRAIEARLTPITGTARDRMTQATTSAAQFLLEVLEESADTGRALLSAVNTNLSGARQQYRSGNPIDDDQAALLTLLLELAPVREHTARHTTAAAWEIDMWTDLLRRAEPQFAAGPAIMLTLCALQAGNGALAAMAVARALQTNPNDQLANLLATAVADGIHPADVITLLTR